MGSAMSIRTGEAFDDKGRVDLRRYGWEPDEEEALAAYSEQERAEA